MRKTGQIAVQLFAIGVLVAGCSSGCSSSPEKGTSAKTPTETVTPKGTIYRDTVPSEKVVVARAQQANAASPTRTPSDKLTPKEEAPELHMGLRVLVDGLRDAQTKSVAQSFEGQLSVFEPCFEFRQQDEIRLDAKWEIGQDGLISRVVVINVAPPNQQFNDCFISQINKLEFPVEARGRRGRLTLGTFAKTGENVDGPRMFQKPGFGR